MAEKVRTTVQTHRSRKKLQMPMETLKYAEWQTLMKERILREVERRVGAESLKKTHDRLGRTAIQEILSVLFPDLEQLLLNALNIHIHFYSQVANAEAGFDLGLKADQIVIGEPSGYAVVFATIKSASCARLLRIEGAHQRLSHLSEARRERYNSAGITSTEFCEEEAIMELLVAALPYATQTIGMSTPSTIVDRAFEDRLGQFEDLVALRGVTRGKGNLRATHRLARDRLSRSKMLQ